MARKKAANPVKVKTNLPDLETARRELLKREARTFMWMLVRLVCIGMLSAIIRVSAPAVRPFLVVFDAVGILLILAPLFTGLGRIFAWRIALGKSYVDVRRFADAEAVLAVLSGVRGNLFDAQGQGRYFRAVALCALNRTPEALPLLREVAERGQDPWQSQAKMQLASAESGNTAPA
jgi:hypothetical protein